MPRTSPEFAGRTHGRRVYPLHLQNENAGLLAIEPAAFQKVNVIAGAPSGNTVNETLTDPVQGNQVLPVGSGVLGGSYWALKSAGVAGAPTVPTKLSDVAATPADPEDVANAVAYVQDSELILGIVMHDIQGSRYDSMGGNETELTANYYDGSQAYFDLLVYETNERTELVAGDPAGQATVYEHTGSLLAYSAGDKLYVDVVSGLLTNRVPRSLISADAVTAGIGATPAFDGTFDPATMTRLLGAFGFRPDRVINGVHPTPVAEVVDVPTAEYRALRIRTLL